MFIPTIIPSASKTSETSALNFQAFGSSSRAIAATLFCYFMKLNNYIITTFTLFLSHLRQTFPTQLHTAPQPASQVHLRNLHRRDSDLDPKIIIAICVPILLTVSIAVAVWFCWAFRPTMHWRKRKGHHRRRYAGRIRRPYRRHSKASMGSSRTGDSAGGAPPPPAD